MANYRGNHRKYVEGTSEYAVYSYGDIVYRGGIYYVCDVPTSYGKLPNETESGFLPITAAGVTGRGTVNFAFSDTPPQNPAAGDQWLDTTTGILYTHVIDNDSEQWVQLNANTIPVAVEAETLDGGTYN